MKSWTGRVALVFLVAVALSSAAVAADPAAPPVAGAAVTSGQGPASQPATWLESGKNLAKPGEAPPTKDPRLVEWVDYTGDIWNRPALTGDWFGMRQKLMDKGIQFNVNLTQTLQGNIGGGGEKRAWHMGGLRYEINVDTGAAGLWPGGNVHIRGETQYGKNNNSSSGAIMPVNTDAIFPAPAQDTWLSEAYYMQFLAPWIGFMGGKMSPRDNNVFSHDETSQFMNAAFNFNPALGTTVPLDFLAAGVIVRPTDWLMVTTLILDTEGTANEWGCDTVFDRGTSVYQMAEFTIKPFEQTGHQRFAWTWSDKSRLRLRSNPKLIIRDIIFERFDLRLGSKLETQGSDCSIMYDFDQYLYTKPGTKDQGIGVFGRFGLSDGEVNPVQSFYSIGVGGKGMIPGRERDTFGLGYYYLGISNKLGTVLKSLAQDEQGVELYYNIAVTNWLHITPDIQVLAPGRSNFSDTAWVAGIRMKIDF